MADTLRLESSLLETFKVLIGLEEEEDLTWSLSSFHCARLEKWAPLQSYLVLDS